MSAAAVVPFKSMSPREWSPRLEESDEKKPFDIIDFLSTPKKYIQRIISYKGLKNLTRWLLDTASFKISICFEDITMLMTLFVLFADSAKLMSAPKTSDDAFGIAITVCFFFFIFEWVAATWSKTNFISFYPKFVKEGYMLSFFWFLDLIAIVSMIADVPMIGLTNDSTYYQGNNTGNYQKAGRVVRLVRLVRLVKLYKLASERLRKRREEAALLELVRQGLADYETEKKKMALYDERQSKLGSQLSDSIIRKVIILILLLLIVLPFLQTDVPDNTTSFTTSYLHSINCNSNIPSVARNVMLNEYLTDLDVSPVDGTSDFLLYLKVWPLQNDPIVNYEGELDSLRNSQLTYEYRVDYDASGNISCETSAYFNQAPLLYQENMYSIILTCFIGVMLVIGSVVFTNDAQELVLKPIERMMNMVEAVAKDPLAKLEFKNEGSGQYETKLLESTIEKLTGLLRVGFGEAGANIIKSNLSLETGQTINPLLPGIRVYGIVGFCDIHHFENIIQMLSNDVLTFVNTIAEIVHSSVHYWGGQCNKNLGNAFVIVWRIGDEETILAEQMGMSQSAAMTRKTFSVKAMTSKSPVVGAISSKSGKFDDEASSGGGRAGRGAKTIDLKRVQGVDRLADRALIGYLKIICEINRSKAILAYRNEPRLTLNGTKQFKVRMGFGLHAGWAIEGAVGSLQKVDATYLSPHVNMAARLETSSRQYGVPLLASHFFHELMSAEGRDFCRKIDVCTVKGSEVPIGVYTYDALQDQVFCDNIVETNRRRHSVSSVGSSGSGGTSDRDPGSRRGSDASDRPLTPPPGTPPPGTRKVSIGAVEAPVGAPTGGTPPPGVRKASFGAIEPGGGNSRRNSRAKTPPPSSAHANIVGLPRSTTPPASGSDLRAPSDSSGPDTRYDEDGDEIIFMTNTDDTADAFDQDIDLLYLRKHVMPEFLQVFNLGVETYLKGEWPEARKHLEAANEMMKEVETLEGYLPGDGPCLTLLEYMEERNWQAPADWKGYRPLTSK